MAGRSWVLPKGCVGTTFITDMEVCYGAAQDPSQLVQ